MRNEFRSRSLAVGMLLVVAFAAMSQEPDALSIAKLKEQIQKLESVDQDPGTPPEVRSINQNFLSTRRTQLRSILASRIEALRKYQSSVGPALTADENKVIEDAIGFLNKELQSLEKQRLANSVTESAPVGSVGRPNMGGDGDRGGAPQRDPAVSDLTRSSNVAQPTLPGLAAAPASDCYTGAPALILTNIDRAAGDIIARNNISPLSAYFPDIFFYTVADAVSSDQMTIRHQKAYQYMGETARTDKQIGASARAAGSTSAIEKPGFASLLGFAVENGIIQQQTNATSLTLSTSPYAFIAASQGDSAETYQKYDFLNRIGISANFNLTNQATPLASVSRKQLNEWSVRVRLFGDRSTRGVDFRNYWNKNIKDKIQRRLVAITHAERVIDSDAALRGLSAAVETQLDAKVKAILATSDAADKKVVDIKNTVLCEMRQSVFDQVRPGGGITVSSATQSVINTALVPELVNAHEELERARRGLRDFFAEQEKKPELTFAYNDERPASGRNYSVFGLLYERKSFEPVKLIANAGFSLYHRPDHDLNQQSVRDLIFALSFEGKTSSPFLTSSQDLSKITFSFTGRYQRIFENKHQPNKKADIAIAQFKLDIPILSGMSIPFSVTYANATDLIKENHVRANFGFSFDADKLFALTQLRRQ